MSETCGNIQSLKDFNIQSLCDTCELNIGGCGYALASNLIDEFKVPGLRQEHITDECDWYIKLKTLDRPGDREVSNYFPVPVIGNLRPLLFKAGIEDRCTSCPSEVKGVCKRHRQLNDLTHTSLKAGGWIHGRVVCCTQTEPERLYQISEPRKQEAGSTTAGSSAVINPSAVTKPKNRKGKRRSSRAK